MSNSTTPCVSRSTSEPQPETASRASVWRSMISSFSPVSRSTRSRNSTPFSAERQASVAISRACLILRLRNLSPQIFSASTARSIAGWPSRPLAVEPLAQPHDARKGIDDAELAGPRRHRDQQPAIVGAEVERGEDRKLVHRRPARALFRAWRWSDGRDRRRRLAASAPRPEQRLCLAPAIDCPGRASSRAKTLRPRLRLRRFLGLPFW